MDAAGESNKLPGEEEEEVEYIDPITLKPDLYAACVANNTEKVVEYLRMEVPGTFIDTATGWTPLHWAAMHGNVPMAKALIAGGASEPYHRLVDRARKAREEEMNGDQESNLSTSRRMDRNDEEDNHGMNGMDEVKFETSEHEDEREDLSKAIEVSIDLTKNTPLLWAAHKGKLGVIWHLLEDGYSPNDVDKMDNNALHLCAAHGDLKILKVLIDDGGVANVVNHYKNHPIDMSKTKEVRDMIAVAAEVGASMTEKDIAEKHERNMRQYRRMVENLSNAVKQAKRVDDPAAMKDMAASESMALANSLSDAIQVGKEWALDQEVILEGERLLHKLEVTQELAVDLAAVEKVAPISSQKIYVQHVYKLEKSLEKAKAAGLDQTQLDVGLDLIAKCQIEYWLGVLLDRLKDVVTADDSNEHDMNKLRAAITSAQELGADEQLLSRGTTFLGRLGAELGMSRAIKWIPPYKLPPSDGVIPEGYWGEKDIGHVKETEGYPLPPPETGEYEWVPAEAFSSLGRAIAQLRMSYDGADQLNANPAIIQEAKEKLAKAEKDYKVLEAKDAADKLTAIEVVKKMAKKLKGGKKKAAAKK